MLSWNSNGEDEATGDTEEEVAEALIVLEGLTDKGYPTEIVAVLNKPTSLSLAGINLKTFIEKTHTSIYNDESNKNFVMTNSAYFDKTDLVENFATKVTAENFMEDKPDANIDQAKVVNISVERLAAKVKVELSETNIALANANEITIGEFDVKTGTNASEKRTIKIKITGWGLNATTKNSYAIKNIDATWTNTTTSLGFAWNDVSNFRSYWAKSTNYGEGTYPASFASVTNKSDKSANATVGLEASTGTDAANVTLNYVSWNELKAQMSKSLYCMENTNTKTILAGAAATDDAEAVAPAFYSAATQVVIGAQIIGGYDLVRYNRTLYTKEAFLARVLNEVNLDITKETTTTVDNVTTTTYSKLGVGDLKVVDIHDGKVTIEAADENAAWVVGTWAVVEGKDEFTKTGVYTGETLAARLETLDVKADYYNKGMMHYVIPIEHLRGGTFTYDNHVANVNEADYGVVRNHFYNLTINQITKLGASVYNPAEDIIKSTVDDTLWMVGASIRILSWKIVNQNVNL